MIMKALSYFFFIFLISCQLFAFPEVVPTTEETASDVFLAFMVNYIDDADEEDMDYINQNWEVDLEKNVQEWSASDASTFLSVLQKLDMKVGNILKLLQATDCLRILKASTHFEPSRIRRGQRSGSHVIFDFLDNKIQLDGIERIMREEWLDNADNIFKSWSIADAENFLNALHYQKIPTYNIVTILRITVNYLHALKNDEINIILEDHVSDPQVEAHQNNEKTSEETTVGSSTELSLVDEQAELQAEDSQSNENEELAETSPTETPQVEQEIPVESQVEVSQKENEEVVTEPLAETPQANEEIIEPQTQQTAVPVISQTTEESTLSMTGSDVFIEYVRDYFREEFEQNQTDGQTLDNYVAIQMHPLRYSSSELPGTWQERITHYARHWSAPNAYAFLNLLEKDIKVAPIYIVRSFRVVSFFSTPYESLLARVNVYREYLTNDEIREIIEKKGVMLFKSGLPENIRKLIEFLIEYLGEDGFKNTLMNSASAMGIASSENTVIQLEAKRDYLEKYLGRGDIVKGREKLKKIINDGGFTGFKSFKVYSDKKTQQLHNTHVDFLTNTVTLGVTEIIQLMENNFQAFSIGTLKELEQSYDHLVDYLGNGDEATGKQIVQRIIAVKRNFIGFANFRVVWDEKTNKWQNTHVNFLETTLGVKKQKIRELIESNIQAFSGGNFERSHRFFIDYLAEGDEVSGNRQLKEIVESNGGNFYGFVNFKTYFDEETGKLQNTHVIFLEKRLGFTKPEIIEIMKNNLQAFSVGTLAQLELSYTYLVDYLGGGDQGHERLKRIIENRGFSGFVSLKVLIRNGTPYNTHANFLEDKTKLGFERSRVIEFMENNLKAFSEGTLAELNQAYEYLIKYLGKGDRAEGKRLLKGIIEERGGLHNFVHFKVNRQEEGEDYKNEVVTFLGQTMHLNQDEIIKLLIETKLQAFPAVNLSDLDRSYAYLIKYLGEGNLEVGRRKFKKIIKKKGALHAFVRFRVIEINGREKNETINFLEQGMTFKQKTVIKVMERDFAKLFESELTEANSQAFTDKLIKIAPYECQEALSA